MKKLNLWLLASLFVAAFTLSACGDDDDSPSVPPADVPDGTIPAGNDLIGTWTVNSTDESYTFTFTQAELTCKTKSGVNYQGSYTLKDGVLSYGGHEYKPALLKNKSVLVFKVLVKDGEGKEYEELAMILFKKGASVSTSSDELQGKWHWYMFGDTQYIRAGWKFDGNKFELVITPWGEKYVGTYTYSHGIVNLKVTAAYTSREPHTGYGSGEGSLDPSTLEATWNVLDADHWHIDAADEGPFIVNGAEAYGCVANLMCLYHKK